MGEYVRRPGSFLGKYSEVFECDVLQQSLSVLSRFLSYHERPALRHHVVGNYIAEKAHGEITDTEVANFQSTYSPATMETKPFDDWGEDLHNLFRIFRDGNVYYLNSVNGETASAVHVLLHKEKIPGETVGAGTGQISFSEGFGEGYRIYMTFSWPVTASRNARQKRTVIYDCFRNNH